MRYLQLKPVPKILTDESTEIEIITTSFRQEAQSINQCAPSATNSRMYAGI